MLVGTELVLRRKFTVLNAYIRGVKTEMSLSTFLRSLKVMQNKPKEIEGRTL